MSRLERVAKEYCRGLRTNGELVWDAWTTAREDSHGADDPVEALRLHLSAEAYEALRDASRKKLATMEVESGGFIPYDRCPDLTKMELSPDFVPRTFIDRLAATTRHE
jgi:hypothetical protein